ncbi:MAG TPA: SusD/RagB family nutrient-binding outer membrane lipoprotein [Chitinophagaceae bacterium]|nr:SusD/RagB family nutrient-binding outer membrane lipoprotein [Chitinophagaceae bacterium]
MIQKIKFFYLFIAVLLLSATGCKKYLDVNKNLNDPTKVPVSILLTGAELQMGQALAFNNGLSDGLSVYMHQHTTREEPDNYDMKGNDFIIENSWAKLHSSLTDLDVVIKQGTEEGRLKYVGIAKILRAFGFSQMVDVWGDVPFTEFNRFKEGIKQPAFDDDVTIYPQLFSLIDAGISDLNNTAINPSTPGTDDVIYAGNIARWIKAANTLKLKLYTQLRKVQNVTPQVTALLANPTTLINTKEESFVISFGTALLTDRHPGFADYTATQRTDHVSPWLYEIMKGYNPIYSGVTDPRIPYYIYNQITPAGATPNTTEYRDGAFVTLYFGSIGPNRNASQQNGISVFGIYPVGGRYDDGQGGVASATSGTGAAPQKLITYADRLYLEAELINSGVIAGNARDVFSKALAASMAQVDYVITNFVKPSQSGIPLLMGANGATPTAAVTTYINAVLANYDAGNADKKLEHIITQKWLASIGSSVDQYTDYRRTGYPVLFDPQNAAMAPGGRVQPPVNGNPLVVPQPSVPVQRTNNFPLSLPWAQTELDLNGNAPAQKAVDTYKVFWMQ